MNGLLPKYVTPFEQVYNFRDVGATVNAHCPRPVLKERLFYRSSRLDGATLQDRKKLAEEYKIKTVVDLRTETEHGRKAQRDAAASGKRIVEMDPTIPEEWNTVHISFIGRNLELQLVRELQWYLLIWFLVLMLFRRRLAAVRLIGKHVLSKKGLVGLSRDSLRFSQPQILQTLEVMTDPDSYPVLVHCTQGKDRTGLIAILVCLVTKDVPVDAIKEDYVLSREGLLPMREQLIPEVAEIGMKLEYLNAPEKLVYEVRRILDEEYGGVEAYLDMIGFDGKRREQLREILKR